MVIRVESRKPAESEFQVIRDVTGGRFVKRTHDMSPPAAEVNINNRSGIYSQRFQRNDLLRIYDDEELVFDGKVFETKKSEAGNKLSVIVWKKEYLDLKDTFCMEAEPQFGYSAWNWGGEEVLEGGGATIKTEGLRPEEIFRAGLGLTTEIQHFFSETDAILASESNTSLQTADVGGRKSTRMLELAHTDETSYESTGNIITRILNNGLEGFNVSPDIDTVKIRMSGEQPSGATVEVRVSIDDGTTWESYQTATYNSSTGLWSDVTFSSISTSGPENQLKVGIRLNGDNTVTPQIRYFRAILTHDVSDTGITAGTIDTYSDPDTDNDTAGGDYNKRNRLEVVRGAVGSTVAPAGEQYTHWFGWIDNDGAAHFRDPSTYYATESDVVFSVEGGTCEDIEVLSVGQIINNLVYVGSGIGGGQIVITETDAYSGGILRNAASIAEFGEIQGMVTEKNVVSIAHADKRARSIARLLAQEQKAITVKLNPNDKIELEVGQKVRVQSPKLDEDAVVRVLSESYTFDAEGLRQRNITLGNNIPSVNNVLASLRRGMDAHNLTSQTANPAPAVSFHDNVDKDHPAELAFYIPEDFRPRRIGLHLKTNPFRTFAKVTGGGSEHEHDIDGEATGPGSEHSHPVTGGAIASGGISVLKKTQPVDGGGSVDTTDYGSQSLTGGNVANTNYGGQTQGNQTTGTALVTGNAAAGEVATASTVSSGGPFGVSLTASTWTTAATQSLGSTFDYFLVFVSSWNDSSSTHGWKARLVDPGGTVRDSGTAMYPATGLTTDSVVMSQAILSGSVSTHGSGTWKVEVQSTVGGSYTDDFGYTYIGINTHDHGRGTLTNAALTASGGSTGSAFKNPALTGSSATKNLSPDTDLTATDLEALLGAIQIGYSEDSGGTGTIIYTQDTVDYHAEHEHTVSGIATSGESSHTHAINGIATAGESAHTHDMAHGIFEYDEDGVGLRYPKDVEVFIRDYPSPGDNNWDGTVANLADLDVPFSRFGKRGRYDQSIEVQNMDISVAFRDAATGQFDPGFKQIWIKPAADATNGNANGLGRMDVNLFIEQTQNVED